MEKLKVECIDGYHDEAVYKINELSYLGKLIGCGESTKTSHKMIDGQIYSEKVTYLEIPCAFDIETTNIYQRDDKGQIDSSELRPYAFMYHWQFCLDDEVCFGRTWEEFKQLLDSLVRRMDLHNNRRLVVWCHNLPFEFQFMRRFVTVIDGFYRDDHKPLRVLVDGGIEFRCSLALSNMSLAKFCENERGVIHYKLTEQYDYEKIRTAITPLTDVERAYCYNDVRGLCECIRSRMRDDTLARMPMTSTGYVRRMYRAAMKQNHDNREILKNGILSPALYKMLRDAFRGGDCHANIRYVAQTLNDITSWDISSSYPAVLMTEKFPIGKWFKISRDTFEEWTKSGKIRRYACLMRVGFEKLKYIGSNGNPYLSVSKCEYLTDREQAGCRCIRDNGRVGYADGVIMTITDVDLEIIRREYEWKEMKIDSCWCSLYDYLPDELRGVLRTLFEQKTKLKGDPDHEYEYMKSKNRINASYGMMVQRLDNLLWHYSNGAYVADETPVEEQLKKYFKSKNAFLRYEWGVWCTAWARYRLRRGLWIVGRFNVYNDTDSIKCDGEFLPEFEELNAELREKAEAAGAFADDAKGKRHYMGVFEYEAKYSRFRTLGAKRYVYEEDGDITATIAGVNKKAGSRFFKEHGIDALVDKMSIEDSGHLVAYYNDDPVHKITVKHCEMTTGANVALCNDTYTIGLSDDYSDLIRMMFAGADELYYTE